MSKKAMVFSKENVIQLLVEAPNKVYLMTKVALEFGICGACCRKEIANMSIFDVDDRGSVIVITIPKTKTNKNSVFTVVNDDVVCGLDLYKKYVRLRPGNERTHLGAFPGQLQYFFNFLMQRNTQDTRFVEHQSLCWQIVGLTLHPSKDKEDGKVLRLLKATLEPKSVSSGTPFKIAIPQTSVMMQQTQQGGSTYPANTNTSSGYPTVLTCDVENILKTSHDITKAPLVSPSGTMCDILGTASAHLIVVH